MIYKSHLVGEPKTRTLCGLDRVQTRRMGTEQVKHLLPSGSPQTITCKNCLQLYYGEPKPRVWHGVPPIEGVPF